MNIHSIAVKKRFYTSLKKFTRYLCFSGKDDIITWTVKNCGQRGRGQRSFAVRSYAGGWEYIPYKGSRNFEKRMK